MHYARKSIQSSIPKSLRDNGFKIKTNREEDFLLINDSENNIILYFQQLKI